MQPSQHAKNIEAHVAKFRAGEKKLWDKILRYYQGKFWTDPKDSEAELQKTSTNLVFAIAETSLSSLVPPNPQISALPRNVASRPRMKSAEGLVNLALDRSRYRREMGMGVQSAVLNGRGWFKTVWDAKSDLPIVRAIDARTVFFDLVAQRPEDMRYIYEATLLSEKQVREKVESGLYDPRVLESPSESFPTWMLPEEQPNSQSFVDAVKDLKSWQKWYLLYEVYDFEEGATWHIADGDDKPCLEDGILYNPYDELVFNANGEDCRGQSEIANVLANIEEYNWLQTYLLTIQRLQVPVMGYDSKALEAEAIAQLGNVPLGGMVPLGVKSGNKTLKDVIQQLPMPTPGALAYDLMAKKREEIAYVSALSDVQRAQMIGARTATEIAVIKSAIQDRLRSRLSSVDEVTESVSGKMLFLASRFMQNEKIQRVTGAQGFLPINPATLEGVEAEFKVVPYSPAESNKAVTAEILRSLIEFLQQNPNISQRRLTEEILGLLDLNTGIMATEEELAQVAASMGGGASGAAPAGVPGAPPPAPAAPPGGQPLVPLADTPPAA